MKIRIKDKPGDNSKLAPDLHENRSLQATRRRTLLTSILTTTSHSDVIYL